jgi:hypothetical protein
MEYVHRIVVELIFSLFDKSFQPECKYLYCLGTVLQMNANTSELEYKVRTIVLHFSSTMLILLAYLGQYSSTWNLEHVRTILMLHFSPGWQVGPAGLHILKTVEWRISYLSTGFVCRPGPGHRTKPLLCDG